MRTLTQLMPPKLAKIARESMWQYRQLTSQSRALPDFIIIGGQRCGTSSLYKCLGQHPQLFPSFAKEVHYFDGGIYPNVDNYSKGQEWYRSYFPFRRNVGANSKVFEASPSYIFNPLVPGRIFELVPDVKLITILRNPTERAISQYFHAKRMKRFSSLSFGEALQNEEERLKPLIESKDYKNLAFIHTSFKSRGLYKEQLERYLKYFPWQNILVLSSEEFFSKPEITLEKVFEFVGVDKRFKVKDLSPLNTTKNKVDIDPKVYEYLNDYFLPHNQALYEFLKKDFGWDNG